MKPEKVVGADGREKTKWVHDVGDGVVLAPDQYELELHEMEVEAAA